MVFNLNLSEKTIHFVDPGFGEITGALKSSTERYSSIIKAPRNSKDVSTLTVSINRINGSANIVYFYSDHKIMGASFIGRCERAAPKF